MGKTFVVLDQTNAASTKKCPISGTEEEEAAAVVAAVVVAAVVVAAVETTISKARTNRAETFCGTISASNSRSGS